MDGITEATLAFEDWRTANDAPYRALTIDEQRRILARLSAEARQAVGQVILERDFNDAA